MAYKAYFWFFLFLLVLTYGQLLSGQPTVYDLMDLPFSLVALAGLFGFSHTRRVINHRFWMAYFPVQIAWDLFYLSKKTYDLPLGSSLAQFNVGLFFSCLLVAPFYIALFHYAYRNASLWAGTRQAD
jgi:hypothetical protein